MKKALFFIFLMIFISSDLFSQAAILKDINPGVASSQIFCGKIDNHRDMDVMQSNYTIFNDKLYFGAYDDIHGYELWVSDGSDNGTTIVKDIGIVKDQYVSTNINGSGLYFSTIGEPTSLTVYNNELFFCAKDGANNYKLWKSDGTSDGTVVVKDIFGGFNNSNSIIVYNNKLYLGAYEPINGLELWESDGTSDGTVLVKDINLGTNSSSPSNFTIYNNKLYFTANDGINGTELWESDGTSNGTVIIRDINFGGADAGINSNLIVLNNKLYFSATDGINGKELWESNGTSNGTIMIKDIYPGSSSSQPNDAPIITICNNKLYFIANDGINGYELWISDGTSNGTIIVKDIYLGVSSSIGIYRDAISFGLYNNKIYFNANDGFNGNELWVSDGTSNGTTMVKDIQVGSSSGQTYRLTATICNNRMYFSAKNDELWETDGTSNGTIKVAGGFGSCHIGYPFTQLISYNNKLYFTANVGSYNFEVWSYNPLVITGVNENNSSTNISIYPNPNNGNIVFEYDLRSTEKGLLGIYDLTGKLILTYNLAVGENKLQITNSGLENGIYQCNLMVDGKIMQNAKLVIIK